KKGADGCQFPFSVHKKTSAIELRQDDKNIALKLCIKMHCLILNLVVRSVMISYHQSGATR
ncbi:MAG: hypothetical protein M3Z94_04235, partial [Lactobacillus panisapium]|nr:hypothetical protein [Lactobacillus panisapium]